jgi:murein DD-endopeptidase MepM/ murein hydrolase activator NlpD
LVWFSQSDKPFRVINLKRGYVYAFLAGFVVFLIAASVLSWTTHQYYERLARLETRYKELEQEKIPQKKHQIEKLEKMLGEKQDSIQNLKVKLVQSKKQLQELREMELKIRNYLGMDSNADKMANQTHQGGFGTLEDEDLKKLASRKSAKGAQIKSTGLISYSLSLEESMREVLQSLRHRKTEMRTTPSILPISGEEMWLSCGYGWRTNPMTSRKEFHSAIDVAGRWKTPIIAPAAGTVSKVGKNHVLGNYIRLRHNKDMYTVYGHLHSVEVERGQQVERRDVLGYMGNTGRSTGTHLHYMVKKDGDYVNPKKYILDRNLRTLNLRECYRNEK